jgi:hypothetical protein
MTRQELYLSLESRKNLNFFRFRNTKYFIVSLSICYRTMPNVFKNRALGLSKQSSSYYVSSSAIAMHIYHKNNTFTRYLDSGKKQFLSLTFKNRCNKYLWSCGLTEAYGIQKQHKSCIYFTKLFKCLFIVVQDLICVIWNRQTRMFLPFTCRTFCIIIYLDINIIPINCTDYGNKPLSCS